MSRFTREDVIKGIQATIADIDGWTMTAVAINALNTTLNVVSAIKGNKKSKQWLVVDTIFNLGVVSYTVYVNIEFECIRRVQGEKC